MVPGERGERHRRDEAQLPALLDAARITRAVRHLRHAVARPREVSSRAAPVSLRDAPGSRRHARARCALHGLGWARGDIQEQRGAICGNSMAD
eukprot:5933219-Prymnesium_polylepis.4